MERNKKRILRAFHTLICKKSLSKITIAEICDEALMSRPTFYHYFHDKYDLVNCVFDELFDRTFQTISAENAWFTNINCFLNELKQNSDFYTPCYKYTGQNNLEHHHYVRVYDFYAEFYEKSAGREMSREEQFSLELYCRGAVFMVAEWGRNGFTESSEWMTEQFKDSMTEDIQRHLIT